MTREEARHIIDNLKPTNTKSSFDAYVVGKALTMAIQALSQEPTEKPMCDRNICLSNEYNGIECDECIVNKAEQEPCDDGISREAVYSILNEYHIGEEEIDSAMDECQNLTVNAITSDVSLLPSVTQKSGKWIYDETLENWRCSKCNETPKTMGYVGTADFMAEHFKFCNHCGAKMESEDTE